MTSLAPAQPRRFTFDTVFDGERVISAPRAKRAFTLEEVEAERQSAYVDGERSTTARADAEAAAALRDIASALRVAFGCLNEAVHAHRSESARLAMACGRAIADAALDRFPEAPAAAALAALARELDARPRLVVRVAADLAERLSAPLAEAAEAAGFAGAVAVKADPALVPAAFVLDWGDGRATFDPIEARARVETALETALAAEGLHAEPPILEPEPARP
jgi:flagellar assembly protein FliH